MGAPRRFDHDDARRRYAAGESAAEIALALGVSWNSVKRAVDEDYRARQRALADRFFEGRKRPCANGCGATVYAHYGAERMTMFTGLCVKCSGESRRTAPHGSDARYRRGCRCDECTDASAASRRAYREARRVPCSNGCGTMVLHERRNPGKPPECRSCAMKRVHAERHAA